MRRTLSAAIVIAIASLVVVPAAAGWTWPADGPVLRPFSVTEDAYAAGQHRGIDVGAAAGSQVRADGRNRLVRRGASRRRPRRRDPDRRRLRLVLQLGAVAVARGGSVVEGDVVGSVGESEDAVTRAPHVHLGVRLAAEPDRYVDPTALLPVRASSA